MTIAFIGKFKKMWDEEYIAQGFEHLGHTVVRISEYMETEEMCLLLEESKPDLVLWTKLRVKEPKKVRDFCKKYKTACWVFDLYVGYQRENQLIHPAFTADYVFTTDGGHAEEFKKRGINHQCVRQGIRTEECFMVEGRPHGAIFVGTHNPYNIDRITMINSVKSYCQDFEWYGTVNDEEVRGTALNDLYANTKIVLGESVYSPYYWSNRVVETLGRGGFLIHNDVPGLKEEYPHLVTYPKGDLVKLRELMSFYMTNNEQREELRKKNFEWVKENYTIEKKCAELLSYIQ